MTTPSHPAPSELQTTSFMQQLPIDTLVQKFRELRDKKKEIEDRHKTELAPYNQLIDEINAALFNRLQAAGAESIKTAHGTAYTSTTKSYSIEDPEAYRMWTQANKIEDAYENRPSKSFIDNYVENTNTLPPGIKVSSYTKINVRK